MTTLESNLKVFMAGDIKKRGEILSASGFSRIEEYLTSMHRAIKKEARRSLIKEAKAKYQNAKNANSPQYNELRGYAVGSLMKLHEYKFNCGSLKLSTFK